MILNYLSITTIVDCLINNGPRGGMVDTKDLKESKLSFYKIHNHPQIPKLQSRVFKRLIDAFFALIAKVN